MSEGKKIRSEFEYFGFALKFVHNVQPFVWLIYCIFYVANIKNVVYESLEVFFWLSLENYNRKKSMLKK